MLIEWQGTLINTAEVECVKYQTYYAHVYEAAYGEGTPSAYIFMKHREEPLIFACTSAEFNELKSLLTRKV